MKLKKKIVLLENYVSDFYLCSNGDKVSMDEDDSKAYGYLTNTTVSGNISFSVAEFFLDLYLSYKELAAEVNRAESEFYFVPKDSDKNICVFNKNGYRLKCNGKEITGTNSVSIDISSESDTVVIEAYIPCENKNSIQFVVGRLIFHKPVLELNYDEYWNEKNVGKNTVPLSITPYGYPVSYSDKNSEFWDANNTGENTVPLSLMPYGFPDPHPQPTPTPASDVPEEIRYTTQYTKFLYINDNIVEPVDKGTYATDQSIRNYEIKAISDLGFYIIQKLSF